MGILLVFGLIASYTSIMLGRCRYHFSLDTYPDIVEAAFGTWGRLAVAVVFYLQLLFEVAIYMLLLSQSLGLLLPSDVTPSQVSWICTVLLIVLANTFTTPRTIRWLSVLNWVTVVLLCIALLTSCILCIAQHYAIHKRSFGTGNEPELVKPEHMKMYMSSVSGVMHHYLRVNSERNAVAGAYIRGDIPAPEVLTLQSLTATRNLAELTHYLSAAVRQTSVWTNPHDTLRSLGIFR